VDHSEKYALLLSELGEAVHLPGLEADDSFYAALDIDGTLVQLQLNSHTGIVTMFARLGKVPDEHRAAVNERLLDANLFWQGTRGATIGADIETHEIVIAKEADTAHLDGPGFTGAVDGFQRAAEAWRRYLADLVGSLEAGDASAFGRHVLPFMMIRG
jgi:hypothetical protein